MNCPKCGVSQDDGREECVSCGIFFDRWQRAQDQAELLRRTSANMPVPIVEESGGGIPKWLALAVVVLICVFGTIWTVRRREARSHVDLKAVGKAKINQINNEGLKMRQRLAEEQQRAQRMRYEAEQEQPNEGNVTPPPREFSLTEMEAMAMVSRCPELAEHGKVVLPKEYDSNNRDWVFKQYPALFNAQRSRLLFTTYDGDIVRHTIGVTGGIIIDDRGSTFEIDLGAKQILRISDMTGTADRVDAKLIWNWEQKTAAEVLLDLRGQNGNATFLRQNGVWRMTGASIVVDGFTNGICVAQRGL